MWQFILSLFKPKKKESAAMKTFDIIVYSPGADGKTHQQHVSGVKAENEKELYELYAMTGEKIQIIKSYTDPDDAAKEAAEQAKLKKAAQKQAIPAKVTVKKSDAPIAKPQEPVKFFKVGSVECKLENGKVYQRQWMQLTDQEMSNYRLISDSSNKIVSMNGKHLEAKKWVLAESDTDDGTATVDAEIDNG